MELKLVCAVRFEKLREASLSLTFGWLRKLPYPDCASPQGRKCLRGGHQIYFKVFGGSSAKMISGLKRWNPDWADWICPECAKAAEADHCAGRRAFWDSIPKFFGLPDRKDLTNFV